MITDIGGNLTVLIVTETGQDWQTFATWYSVFRNLPDAKVAILIHRNGNSPFAYYQWAKRLKIKTIRTWPFDKDGSEELNWLGAIKTAQESKSVQGSLLVIKPFVMVLEPFDHKFLNRLNSSKAIIDENVWFLNDINAAELLDRYVLEDLELNTTTDKICFEAKETDLPVVLVSYKKGCGRWIDTAKGCPFSSAGGLITNDMTSNEVRVNELWQKMVPLYNAVA